jgi:hypothetical protein
MCPKSHHQFVVVRCVYKYTLNNIYQKYPRTYTRNNIEHISVHREEVVYYESIKRELKIRPIYECRCDERLQTKTKKRNLHALAYTEKSGELTFSHELSFYTKKKTCLVELSKSLNRALIEPQ